MDDDPGMLRQTLIICGVFWLGAFALVFLPACTPAVQVNHEVPQLDRLATSAETAINKLAAPAPCPTLAMPPIPQECIIDIRGDSMTASSPECELLVRFYVRARQLLKPAVPSTSAP
jgi:hypothetical protein